VGSAGALPDVASVFTGAGVCELVPSAPHPVTASANMSCNATRGVNRHTIIAISSTRQNGFQSCFVASCLFAHARFRGFY
jgi:hypothetical protein